MPDVVRRRSPARRHRSASPQPTGNASGRSSSSARRTSWNRFRRSRPSRSRAFGSCSSKRVSRIGRSRSKGTATRPPSGRGTASGCRRSSRRSRVKLSGCFLDEPHQRRQQVDPALVRVYADGQIEPTGASTAGFSSARQSRACANRTPNPSATSTSQPDSRSAGTTRI